MSAPPGDLVAVVIPALDEAGSIGGVLEAIAEAMRVPGVYAVNGPVTSTVAPIDPFVHSLSTRQGDGVATANLAVRKEMLTAVGGFDETFTAPYFEDFDLAKRLEAGSVFVNSFEKPTPQAIFGGHKQSGIGGEWGTEGIKAYCNPHVIHLYK